MKRYDLVVFDWDGTLMDSAATIVDSIQRAAEDLGLCVPDEARARHVIGLGLQEALAQAVPELEPARYGEMVERYRHHYLTRDHELRLFPHAVELVEELAAEGYWLAVATGKSRLGLNRALAFSGLGKHFHATRCADECHSKPHPQMLLELMDELMCPPRRTVMVGDTTHDLQLGRNAGTDVVAILHGAHPPHVLANEQPTAEVGSLVELRDWLRRHDQA